jgi:hypothetical protein
MLRGFPDRRFTMRYTRPLIGREAVTSRDEQIAQVDSKVE